MAYISRAGGYPDYNSNGSPLTGFIPEIFSGLYIEKLFEKALFPEIATTRYEGEIKGGGDSIVIPTQPSVTINDYEIGTDMTSEHPTDTAVILTISGAKYWNVEVSDIDERLSHMDLMNMFSDVAAKAMTDKIDTIVMDYLPTSASSDNTGTTAGAVSGGYNLGTTGAPVTVSASNALELVLMANACLDEQNVEREGRYIVIPSAWSMYLKNSDVKSACIMGDGKSVLRKNARSVGNLDGMEVLVSNNVSHSGTSYYQCPFGNRDSFAFVTALTKSDIIPSEKRFSQLLRGLNCYGFKTIREEGIGNVVVKF